MKKIKYIGLIGIISLVFIMTGCAEKSLKRISYQELADKFSDKDTFVLYLGSSQCSHCQEYKPILEKVVADKNVDVYYIDLAEVNENQYREITEKTNLEGTPTIVYVKKGIVNKSDPDKRIVGTVDEDETIDYFKKIGVLKTTKK